MEKKYKTKLDPKTGLLRIIALRRFSDVKKGEKGGLIEKEENLSQEGDCWVYREARVFGDARVYDDACIAGNARVYDNAKVFGNARVWEYTCVGGNAEVFGNALVRGGAKVYDNAKVFGNALVRGSASVFGDAVISGYTWVRGGACVYGNVKLYSTDSDIDTSIKNNKDYVILIIERKFYIVSLSNFESHLNGVNVSTVDENYLKNIQTIRQVYGKEI
jgi:carbonic anhydrase/acetyltransferase-like protein (isoleucine patch superfamily)